MLTRRDWMITAAGATAALSTAGEARSDDDEPDSADDGRPNGLFFEPEQFVSFSWAFSHFASRQTRQFSKT